MPSTTNYDLPYPTGADIPDGAGQMQDLAEAIDAEFTRVGAAVRSFGAFATINTDLTATHVDVPGTSVTFPTVTAGAILIVRASFDLGYSNTSGQEDKHMFGLLSVDGVEQSGQVLARCVPRWRATLAGRWRVTLGAAGSHTVKLRTFTTREAGAADCAVHTCWTGVLYD